MAAVQSDLQKLENLLKSATNERQRKMYQSLLDKARENGLSNQSAANSAQTAQSKVDKGKVTATSSLASKKQTTKKAEALSQTDTSKLKTTNKTDKEEMLSLLKQIPPSVDTSDDSDRQAQSKEESDQPCQKKKSSQQSKNKQPVIFQAVGLIRCTPYIKEDRLYITIEDRDYELERGQKRAFKYFDELKQEIAQNGSRSMWLRVYPKIAHDTQNQEIRYWFTLVRALFDESQCQDERSGFVFRGIWQYVPFCSEPVILIHRNFNNIKYYQRLYFKAKKAFTRLNGFPVVWSAPVEPSRYNPELDYDQQMPRYFVQVRAVLKNGRFEVTEMISEPSLEIPRYIKPPRKNNKK